MNIDFPSAGQSAGLRSLWQEAFGDSDAFLDAFFTAAAPLQRCRCITVEGQVAAALYWFDCSYGGQSVAYLYAVATRRVFRGKGLCHRLLEDTHRLLTQRGYAGVLLVPGSEELRSFYAAQGYETATRLQLLSQGAGPQAVPLRQLTARDYAALRRQYLPEGSVIQEGENLSFLETQATLYAGTDFLLAARQDGETLEGLELLGNAQAAPEILCALGCREGTFRIPGTQVPFAMWHPLCSQEAPQYFGLAFD